MNKDKYIKISKIIEVEQPIGRFLIGAIKAKDLLTLTHSNPRRYNKELDDYVGIQREIIPNKIEQLVKFINTHDSTFPNSIIGTLNPNNYEYDSDKKTLSIFQNQNSFAVIDGQHRLASFKNNPEIAEKFELIVSFFLGLDLEEQAYLFSIINMTQKKLNPSLMQDLTELFTITTPEKFAHNMVKIFNEEKSSPWFRKIKRLGKSEIYYTGIISQYTFTKGIINLMADTERYYEIRDILKNSKNNRTELNRLKMDSNKYIFWIHYINKEDNFIFKVLNSYFMAISEVFKKEWGSFNYILNKTTGYNAFMRFLRDIYKLTENKEDLTKKEYFVKFLLEVQKKVKDLKSYNYSSGSSGEDALYYDLIGAINTK